MRPRRPAGWLVSTRDSTDLEGVLHTTSLMRSAAQNVRDLVAGYGELWSSTLFARLSHTARRKQGAAVRWLDARQCVVVEWGPLGPRGAVGRLPGRPDGNRCGRVRGHAGDSRLRRTHPRKACRPRWAAMGSDFSASIFGALLEAAEIHIWTDVDGVLSLPSPRRFPMRR